MPERVVIRNKDGNVVGYADTLETGAALVEDPDHAADHMTMETEPDTKVKAPKVEAQADEEE